MNIFAIHYGFLNVALDKSQEVWNKITWHISFNLILPKVALLYRQLGASYTRQFNKKSFSVDQLSTHFQTLLYMRINYFEL